jgi:hypothetical protein
MVVHTEKNGWPHLPQPDYLIHTKFWHTEERQTGDPGHLPDLRDQDVQNW